MFDLLVTSVLTYLFFVIMYIYTQYITVNNYKHKNGSLKLMEFCSLFVNFVCCLIHQGSTVDLLLLQISRSVVLQTRYFHLSRNTLYLLSPRLCFFIVLNVIYVFIVIILWRVRGLSCKPNNQLYVLYH